MPVKVTRKYRGQTVTAELVRCEQPAGFAPHMFVVVRTINGHCRQVVRRETAAQAIRAALHLGYTRIDRSFARFGEWRENHHDRREG